MSTPLMKAAGYLPSYNRIHILWLAQPTVKKHGFLGEKLRGGWGGGGGAYLTGGENLTDFPNFSS